jgi:hypothetical protein
MKTLLVLAAALGACATVGPPSRPPSPREPSSSSPREPSPSSPCEAAVALSDAGRLEESIAAWDRCYSFTDVIAAHERKRAAVKANPELSEQPIPQLEQRMLDAFRAYLGRLPDGPNAEVVRYRLARVLYEYQHLEEAAPQFRAIVDDHPDSDEAVPAAHLLLDCLAIMKSYSELEATVDRFLQTPQLVRDADFKRALETIRVGIARVCLRRAGRVAEAHEAERMLKKLRPDSPLLR